MIIDKIIIIVVVLGLYFLISFVLERLFKDDLEKKISLTNKILLIVLIFSVFTSLYIDTRSTTLFDDLKEYLIIAINLFFIILNRVSNLMVQIGKKKGRDVSQSIELILIIIIMFVPALNIGLFIENL